MKIRDLFLRKERARRPRGPNTPAARQLNWEIFLKDESTTLKKLNVPSACYSSQEAFEQFWLTGACDQKRVEISEDSLLRGLLWRYRERTKRRVGVSFIELTGEMRESGLREKEIDRELSRSDRWGINDQPSDREALSNQLSALPLYEVHMMAPDTLRLRFIRPLTREEEHVLLNSTGLGKAPSDMPFAPGEPVLEAICWWD